MKFRNQKSYLHDFAMLLGSIAKFAMPSQSFAKLPKVTKIESFDYDLQDVACIRKLIVLGHQETSREVIRIQGSNQGV